jgi:non-ribosomal peptide synthetase component F
MIGHFNVLVESIISNPDLNISDIEILTPAEKHKLLLEWNDTAADYPKDKCIHQLFEEQVEKTPDNIAVVFEGTELTYRELNNKSNQLGHYLQTKGIKPDSLVGICVDRSLEMIVGLLGILKSGGAYVPIDPTYPEERISYMLEDADCEIVLSQEHLKLPKTNSKIVYLDADWRKIEKETSVNVKSEVKSNNLAYVIYTSGSTGRPKGTLIEHKSVIRLASNRGFSFIRNQKAVLQYATISFDASIFEIWC